MVKGGEWMESGGEDRREEKEVAVAVAGRVSMCKRFLQPGMIEHLCPELWVMSGEERENFCPGNFPNYLESYGGGGGITICTIHLLDSG